VGSSVAIDRRAAAGRDDPRASWAGVRAGGSARPRQACAVHLRQEQRGRCAAAHRPRSG